MTVFNYNQLLSTWQAAILCRVDVDTRESYHWVSLPSRLKQGNNHESFNVKFFDLPPELSIEAMLIVTYFKLYLVKQLLGREKQRLCNLRLLFKMAACQN